VSIGGEVAMPKDTRISQRVHDIPKSAIHEMTRLSRQQENVAFLSWAKPTTDTPEHIKEGAVRAIRDGRVSGYSETSGLLDLREAIVEKLQRDNGIQATPSQILVTVGAIEGISAAIMAVVDPGDEVILPTPTYSTHIQQVVLASAKPVLVPTCEEKGFCLDIEAIRNSVTPKTKAILYCSPANPTGTVFDRKQLEALVEIALVNNLMIITDEAYE
jgi:aminotransferase